MNCRGWRTVVVEKTADMSLRNNSICVTGENEATFPISQVRNVLLTNQFGTISLPLINELITNNVSIIVCDNKHVPTCEMVNLGDHSNAAGNLIKQSRWDDIQKGTIWKSIVEIKIANQIKLLTHLRLDVNPLLVQYLNTIETNDITNREALAAKVYFGTIFGHGFRRHAPDSINGTLNYGYTIVRTSLDRIITSYGYNTALGIKHNSASNRFNLSCDVMEVFRPFVDEVVYGLSKDDDNKDYRAMLQQLLQSKCIYKRRELFIEDAMSEYFLDLIQWFDNNANVLGEFEFV